MSQVGKERIEDMHKGYEGDLNEHSRQFGSSRAHAGQVPVHHTPEGDRRDGTNAARGYVSPLGGEHVPYATNKQIYAEKRDRAQSPIGVNARIEKAGREGRRGM